MESASAALEGDDKHPPQTASTTWSILDTERRWSSSKAADREAAAATPTPQHRNPYGSNTERPDSYGSGNRAPTDSGSYSQFSSGSSVLAGDYWPKVDSDESDEASPSKTVEPVQKPKKSSTKRFFRYLSKKLGASAPRYGHLPNDEREHDRNEIQHRVVLDLFEDKYHLAPVSNPRRVLDVGTGPGTWAIEYAERHPQTTVIGIDIEYVRPHSSKPKNCTFMVMDATKDWEFEEGFDLIHVRMLGDMQAKGHLVESIYSNLNPGGWAEFTEWIVHIQSPDHSLDGGAFMRWNKILRKGLRELGSSVFYPLEYRRILALTGFINIQENKYAAPTNACYPGKRLQRIGNLMTRNWLSVLEPLSMPVFGALGWSQESLDHLIDDVKKEIVDPKFHSYMTLMTVSCQKPMSDSAASSSISFTVPQPSK
ncbi:hypothetical protein PpBr36_08331 [Pyricularia pennisetigena]|uniref:hypothetical protein n=1 Tax=Pyricularia pennisetigena TaxID=1578925 RepID=UPI0011513749|nr:hypothetical protein PpBr36_08331 [Pyricularia pennisetigena]TLS24633.1 hypothetical protein PpBr36_08331 [Pyricularia pennisetigena]